MQASACGIRQDAGASAPARSSAKSARRITAAAPPGIAAGARAPGTTRSHRRPDSRPRRVARLEHALFILTLGSVGYVWLGSLLAEAARGL